MTVGKAQVNTQAGIIKMTYVDDWATGRTTYTVTGSRVSGTFVVSLGFLGDTGEQVHPDVPDVVIELGGDPVNGSYWHGDRTNLPVINTITVRGTFRVDADVLRQRRLTAYDLWYLMRVDRGGYAPEATRTRAAAVAGGLVRHWITRPDGHALRLAAVRAELTTGDRITHHNDVVRREQDRIDRATAARDEARRHLAEMDTARAAFDTFAPTTQEEQPA